MAFPRCLEGNCDGRRHPLGQHLSPRSGSAPPALTPEDRDRVQQVIDQTNEMNQNPANNHDAPSSGGGSSGGSSSSSLRWWFQSSLPTYTPTQQQQDAIDAFEGDPAMEEAMRNEFRWRVQQEAAPVLTTTPLNLDLTVPAGDVSPSGQVSPVTRPQASIAGAGADSRNYGRCFAPGGRAGICPQAPPAPQEVQLAGLGQRGNPQHRRPAPGGVG